MGYWTRSWTAVAIAVAALGTVPAAVVVFQPNGEAKADVCADVGRRVSVSGCANIADVVAPYVPPLLRADALRRTATGGLREL